ncbi:glycosyltransferase family 2 protein [Chitinophaga filiformis]|uniref:glycosyltransferase family 2 protein n=1 Tax=Chitinophaga filiformis TaxID=104663 RepID=UPI001F3709F4|nr:glycosyltransferase family 2 protein [Chitinophaga filiformis]MCF6401660.1 glycosyltransferase family 2 protein [Chitinophaga filiformis]
MKVSGFTFVRNAVKYDYPVVAAISSILPLCDEVIVSVGNCDDGTLELIQSIGSPKIKITHSVWDDSLKEGGRILAVETDKAFAHISPDADWAFYIQADEVVHEQDYQAIRAAMREHLDDKRVEGLLFKYMHFFGSYDYVGDSRTWYQHEIRVIRNDKRISSYRDAQGFRKEGEKLHVKQVNASMYHYGWVKDPEIQAKKLNSSFQLYHGANEEQVSNRVPIVQFDYGEVDSLAPFKGTHPEVMKERIKKKNWQFTHDISRKKFSFKDSILYWIEKKTGKRLFDYRNYKII